MTEPPRHPGNVLFEKRSHAHSLQKTSSSREERNHPSASLVKGGRQSWVGSEVTATQSVPSEPTVTKNNQMPHFDAQALFSGLVPLNALFLKGTVTEGAPLPTSSLLFTESYFPRVPVLILARWHSKFHSAFSCPYSEFPSYTDSFMSLHEVLIS